MAREYVGPLLVIIAVVFVVTLTLALVAAVWGDEKAAAPANRVLQILLSVETVILCVLLVWYGRT